MVSVHDILMKKCIFVGNMEQDIFHEITNLVDEDYRTRFMADYPRNARKVLGVPQPRLRELAFDYAFGPDWRTIVDEVLTDATFEEMLLKAYIIGTARTTSAESFERATRYISKIDSSQLCDAACLAFRFAVEFPDETLQFLHSYLNSQEPFAQRFALVLILDYFVKDDFIEKTLDCYHEVVPHSPEATDALAWGYSIFMLGFPKRTLKALGRSELADEPFEAVLNRIESSPRIFEPIKQRVRLLHRHNESISKK